MKALLGMFAQGRGGKPGAERKTGNLGHGNEEIHSAGRPAHGIDAAAA